MADYGQAFSDFGGAVTDLFAAQGSKQAGAAYGKAASIAEQNEFLTQRSTQIQLAQENITVGQAVGTETAQTAGAGFQTGTGSAADLMRASLQQGALAKQLIANQGEITAQGYAQQSQAYLGQQQAAQTQAKGQSGGGLFGAISGIFSLF